MPLWKGSAVKSDPPFTYPQFAGDIKDNAQRVLKSQIGAFSTGATLVFNLLESEEENAKAMKVAPDQYMIVHYSGLANRLFQNAVALAQGCLADFPSINATANLYARLIAGCSSEMVFWHEYGHVARGHLAFLKSEGVGDGVTLHERALPEANLVETDTSLALRRFVEIDADIYGAQFLFARAISCMRSRANTLSTFTWMLAYVMGIRSMYEAIYDESEDFLSSTSDHPHSLARAYTAVAYGVAASVRLGMSNEESDEWIKIALIALDRYEREQNRGSISIEELRAFMEEDLSYWQTLESKLIRFQMISRESHTGLLKRIRSWLG